MAAYIQFYELGADKPIKLDLLDERICAERNAEVHPTQYYCGWFDCIAFRLASGSSYDKIRAEFKTYINEDRKNNPEMFEFYTEQLAILDYLEANYRPRAWSGR